MLGRIVERNRAIQMRSPIYDVPCMQQGQAHEAMPHHEGPRRFLLICKGQELDSKLTHHVAVERDKVRDPKAVENREQQQWIFRRFSERFSLLDQQTCPLHGRPGFQRRVAADMEEWGYECNLKLDFFATQGGRGGQGRDLVERTPELFGGLNKRRALRRPQSGFAPKCCGSLHLPGLGAVTRQQLGLILGELCELTFQGFGDSGMKRTSRLAQQRAVSNVPYQCMLEKVGRVRRARSCRSSKPARMRRSSVVRSSASGLRTTAASRGWVNSRPIAAPICASSLAGPPSRSSRAMSEACRLGGTPSAGDGIAATARAAAVSLPASSTALVISSTNKGIPSVRSMMSCRMLADGSLLPTMRSIMAPTSCSASRLIMRAVT